MFAVRSEYFQKYLSLQRQHFKSGYVAEIDNNKQTIIDIIKKAIADVKQTQTLNIIPSLHSNPEICSGFTAKRSYATTKHRVRRQSVVEPEEIVIGSERSFDRSLYNVLPGEKVDYTVNFAASDNACHYGAGNSDFVIKTSRLSDQIKVKMNLVCGFACQEETAVWNAVECSYQGSFQCGVCTDKVGLKFKKMNFELGL